MSTAWKLALFCWESLWQPLANNRIPNEIEAVRIARPIFWTVPGTAERHLRRKLLIERFDMVCSDVGFKFALPFAERETLRLRWADCIGHPAPESKDSSHAEIAGRGSGAARLVPGGFQQEPAANQGFPRNGPPYSRHRFP